MSTAPLFTNATAKKTQTKSLRINEFITLTKPGVLLLVVFTGITGLLLAPGVLSLYKGLAIIGAIALGSAGAAAFNMWYDRDIDALMPRTQKRPIPKGTISPKEALFFAWGLSLSALVLMQLVSNLWATLTLAFSIFFYAVIYTQILKRSTPQNIVIGGAAGAFPPVIGWVAAGGEITSSIAWILFALIFFWTPSHFWALALFRCRDYELAKVPMLPNTHGIKATKIQILAYTVLMIALSYAFYLFPFNGSMSATRPSPGLVYFLSATILNGLYAYLAIKLMITTRPKASMQLFSYSIFYLFLLFASLIADAKITF